MNEEWQTNRQKKLSPRTKAWNFCSCDQGVIRHGKEKQCDACGQRWSKKVKQGQIGRSLKGF